ncbi:hypothetical protein K6119_14550 [Paracrocinitomix mangrovi]|uniref:hypothetical protein n=1 Tax=Paracrocinitomix mangrovi TaxID=2862509 RepID=UPI001C8E09B9|nr:hypothetical protein [Paracrocinitomix mangrovi]UKN00952.1 hypothetical protein K6119_14550 [Paracrocinitomix mangrovi]
MKRFVEILIAAFGGYLLLQVYIWSGLGDNSMSWRAIAGIGVSAFGLFISATYYIKKWIYKKGDKPKEKKNDQGF